MGNRTKLEKRAADLGVEVDPSLSEEELRQLVDEAQASKEADEAELNAQNAADEPEEVFGDGFHFYKSRLAGLSVQIGDTPERDEQPTTVRFQPFEFHDEAKGEDYNIGFLATDEQDAIEILADDVNVEEIDEDEYRKQTAGGKKARL